MKKPFIVVIVFLFLFLYVEAAQKVTDYKAFEEKLRSIASSPFSRQRVKYIYFFLNREKVHNVRYFSGMLESFLLTMNIRGTVYNIDDNVMMAIVQQDAEVNTEFLKTHFDGAFNEVTVRYPG